MAFLTDEEAYRSLETNAAISAELDKIHAAGRKPKFDRRYFEATKLGLAFCKVACDVPAQ